VRRARGGFIGAGGHGRGQGRTADLTERRGERRRADQGQTRVPVRSAQVLARVVAHPSLLSPWSVHKTSSPPYRLPIMCGVIGFCLLVAEIWSPEIRSVSLLKPEANPRFCRVRARVPMPFSGTRQRG
jgi:hypothetical protein